MNDTPNNTPTLTVIEGGKGSEPDPLFVPLDVDTPEWDDLVFIARRHIRRTLDRINWAELGFEKTLDLMLEPDDVKTVVRLMQNAKLEIVLDYVDGDE